MLQSAWIKKSYSLSQSYDTGHSAMNSIVKKKKIGKKWRECTRKFARGNFGTCKINGFSAAWINPVHWAILQHIPLSRFPMRELQRKEAILLVCLYF